MKRKKTFYTRYGKRWFDLLLTIPGFVVISPALLMIALLVRLQLGSPVLFKQVRPGLHGKPFTIYKFRTMTNARNNDGKLLPDAKRLTKLGKFLRVASLDELPELWNMIKGDMSLVGPRPLHPEDTHSWHLNVIQLELEKIRITRDEFIEKMADKGTGTSVHLIPLLLARPLWFQAGEFSRGL